MPGMWRRRFLTAIFVVVFAAIGAAIGVQGYAVFLLVAVVVPLALILGSVSEQWLQTRQHRPLR